MSSIEDDIMIIEDSDDEENSKDSVSSKYSTENWQPTDALTTETEQTSCRNPHHDVWGSNDTNYRWPSQVPAVAQSVFRLLGYERAPGSRSKFCETCITRATCLTPEEINEIKNNTKLSRRQSENAVIESQLEKIAKLDISDEEKMKRRNSYDITFKLKVVEYAKIYGNRPAERKFGVAEKMVRDWRAKETQMLNVVSRSLKKMRTVITPYEDIENKLEEWVNNLHSNGMLVSRSTIRLGALKLAKEANYTDFKASAGWCSRFVVRFDLVLKHRTRVDQMRPEDRAHQTKQLRMLAFGNPGKFMEDFDPEKSTREMKKVNRRIYKEKVARKNQMYDENGLLVSNGIDLCDCLIIDCPGCHFPCPKCSSEKCGHDCRNNRRWIYESVEVEGTHESRSWPYPDIK